MMEIKTTSKFRKDLKQAKKKGLLIYKISGDTLILTLARTGSHSDLFKK